jgi:hypothetical protein
LGAGVTRRDSSFRCGPDVEILHFLAGPWGFTQKGEAGLNARITLETADLDPESEFLPAVVLHQCGYDLFESHTVEGIFGLGRAHMDFKKDSTQGSRIPAIMAKGNNSHRKEVKKPKKEKPKGPATRKTN